MQESALEKWCRFLSVICILIGCCAVKWLVSTYLGSGLIACLRETPKTKKTATFCGDGSPRSGE